MKPKPKMPLPSKEMTPRELLDSICRWAESIGLRWQILPHTSEFAKVILFDSDGTYTWTTIPNAHRGRRLRRDQVRYPIKELNNFWRDK